MKKRLVFLAATLVACNSYFTQLDAGKKKNKKTIVQKKNNKNKSKNKKKNNGIDKDLAFLNSIATPKVEEVFAKNRIAYWKNLNDYEADILEAEKLAKSFYEHVKDSVHLILERKMNTDQFKKAIDQKNKKSELVKNLFLQFYPSIQTIVTWYENFEKNFFVFSNATKMHENRLNALREIDGLFKEGKNGNIHRSQEGFKERSEYITMLTEFKGIAKTMHNNIKKIQNTKLHHIRQERERIKNELLATLENKQKSKKQNKKPKKKNAHTTKQQTPKKEEEHITIKTETKKEAPKKDVLTLLQENHRTPIRTYETYINKTLTQPRQIIAEFNQRIDRWYTKPTEALKETNPDLFSTESQLNQKEQLEIQQKKDAIIEAHTLPKELIPFILKHAIVCNWSEGLAPFGSISYNIPGILVKGKTTKVDGVFSVGINSRNECFHYSFSTRAYRNVLQKISETRKRHNNKRHIINENDITYQVIDKGSYGYFSNPLKNVSYILFKPANTL